MKIRASVHNSGVEYRIAVSTGGRVSPLVIPARADGVGSSINGGGVDVRKWKAKAMAAADT